MSESEKKRREVAAEQVKRALKSKGISKKHLAEMMGKSPSEVTRWVSGHHNFTLDVLEDISDTLGVPITGVSNLVCGYGTLAPIRTLNDPAAECCTIENIQLSPEVYSLLKRKALDSGMSVEGYAASVLDRWVVWEVDRQK